MTSPEVLARYGERREQERVEEIIDRATSAVPEVFRSYVPMPGIPEPSLLPPSPIDEIPPGLKAAIGAVGLEDWSVEDIEAYPLTPEGLIHPESPLFAVITAPGEKIRELVETHTYVELREIGAYLPAMGPALPGIGEIKIEMPDILGGLKNIGTYGLMAGALILGYLLLTRKK